MIFNFQDIFTYLQSSKKIEHILAHSYRQVEYPFNKRGVYARNLPLFNKELYDLIFKLKRLPTVEEFEAHYVKKYLTRPANRVALQYHTNTAYKALISELHFYFILKESGLFDDVKMSYTYDLEAKTDLLIRKNGKMLGIQLFSGDENYRLSKLKSIEKLQLSYELKLYNLRDHPERKNIITGVDGSKFNLYGKLDGQFFAEYLSDAPNLTPEELMKDEPTDVFTLLPNVTIQNGDTIDTKDVQYSYIYIGLHFDHIEQYLSMLHKQGKKVFALYQKSDETFTATDGKIFTLNGKSLEKTDGLSYLKKYSNHLKHFNFYQYKIEHANPTFNIAVNAGAGSGKTTTLVSRILYLLFTKQINSLHEIVMITFTNEAASNMKEALEERLEKLYRTTGSEAHYEYLQQINFMKIVTIPTFAKEILKQFSHYIGLSVTIDISEMVVKRRGILERCLDATISGHSINPFGRLDYHKIIRFLENIWDKFNQKGIVEQELTHYLELNPQDDTLKLAVTNILKEAEEQFTALKFDEDFLTVADLTRFLKLLIDRQVPLHELNKHYKYLLVDEFQDTDIAQIQFIATIAAKANLHLTVVGDTKQSVYRFRGADSTAFSVLDDYLEEIQYQKLHTYHLIENFRSSQKLIEEMEKTFGRWREKELLPPNEQPMYSHQDNFMDEDQVFSLYTDEFTVGNLLADYALMPPKQDKPHVLAVLVRNNDEALEIGRMLSNSEDCPQYEVRTEGRLYVSKSARDLGILLHSWLYAKSDHIMRNQALFSLSETAFCIKEEPIHFTVENRYQNSRQKKPSSFIRADDFSFKLPEAWHTALELMKEKPILPIVQEFLEQSDYVTNLNSIGFNEIEVLKYELNLEKIITEIYEKFNNNATLIQVYDWLKLQILTNRESDEAEIEESAFDDNFVRVMTVHKSKGLQFHTVLIAYPNNAFILKNDAIKKDIIVQIGEKDELKFGWKYYDKPSEFEDISSNYHALRSQENEEQRREEARILYVAMTRAEQSLKIYELDDTQESADYPNTWGELLLM
ncbi:UvrD-helicase domain-containing protein [Bacillus cereus]|uniref:DNA 3'-5' helicase n=1 Tax=Bacillus cereus TaxID=1396 RepID=A0A9X8J058_BACCE|nr:ATP-dependent helicase [Bacillus cereus]RWQ73462.1 ATP-dependent helicase [Bacillus cereus]